MTEVVIYSKTVCPYCVKAKILLDKKSKEFGFEVNEIKVTTDELRQEVIEKSDGRMTVPQIFINGIHIGGSDDLYALEEKGELDKLFK